MKRSISLAVAFLAAVCLAVQLPTAHAAIVSSGNLDPADPASWDSTTDAYVGKTDDGALEVDGSSDLYSHDGYIGYESTYVSEFDAAKGVVTVDSTGSTWTNSGILYVGHSGNGTLNIIGGAAVSNTRGYVGFTHDAVGVVTIQGAGSTWTNSEILHVGYEGRRGTLNITDGAAVSDTEGHVGCWPAEMGMVTVDGAGSTWTNSGDLYVGLLGHGTLDITDGAVVSNGYANLGMDPESTGVVTVDGAGSTWTNSGDLRVGLYGSGTLSITGGAAVSNSDGYISHYYDSVGAATVDGAGSMWNNTGELYIGEQGTGTLHISDGGNVSATSVSINSQSLLTIDVGNGSVLEIGGGSGAIDNDGQVRILAGAGATAGNVYEPIIATDWSDSGGYRAYRAVGGEWDETSHQLTVSDVVPGVSGSMITIFCDQRQRTLIDDPQTGWSVGASFVEAFAAAELHWTATAASGTTLGELESLLDDGDSVRGAWMFEAGGDHEDAGGLVYLSFDLGPGFDRSDLNLWHYDGSQWSEFVAADLTYNGDYASFTITDFSGYAVSAVPEPGALVMLFGAVLALAVRTGWGRKLRFVNEP